MGIIEKQATKNAIYSYLGVGIGFFTILWQSHTFNTDQIGLQRVLISVSTLFGIIANLGFSAVTTRFFPYFKNKEKGHHGFLFYALLVAFFGFVVCTIIFYLLKDRIIADNIEKSRLFVDYLFYVLPLSFFTLFFYVFDTYLRACYSSVIGSIAKDFIQRILILGSIALYFFQLISFPVFIFLYVVCTCTPTLILLYTIKKQGEWYIKPVRGFINKELSLGMIRLALFSILSSFSGAIILNIDVLMVNAKLGLAETGIYGIAIYFGSVLLIPARSIYRIISGPVAEAFKKNDLIEIHKLYKKSSNSLLAIGLLLFIGIAINIDNIMQFLPPAFASGKYVIIIISAGYLFEIGSGINQLIIANSKYYYFDTFIIIVSVFLTVLANYILIRKYGIIGSGLATAITVIVSNLLRFSIIYVKYKIQPFDFDSVKVLLISMIVFFTAYIVPAAPNFIIDIAIKSCIAGGLFIFLILKLEATPDLNQKIRKNLFRITKNF